MSYNSFKSTKVCGLFQNSDYPDASVLANAIFDRDLTVTGNLKTSSIQNNSGNIDISGNNINFNYGIVNFYKDISCNAIKLNGNITSNALTITPTQVGYLSGVTSDIQTQLTNAGTSSNCLTKVNPVGTGLLSMGSTGQIQLDSIAGKKISLYLGLSNDGFTGLGAGSGTLIHNVATGATTAHIFQAGWTTSGTELMRIRGDGCVGIGTSTPSSSYKLDVNGGINGFTLYENAVSLASKYQSIANMSSYLTSSIAASTYTTLANVLSNNNAFTGTSTHNSYLPTSTISPVSANQFCIKSYVDTYQPISSMVNYLTTAVASSTYQTISGMSSYLSTAVANSTYQTISGMSSYLTTAVASNTYQTIANLLNQPFVQNIIVSGTSTYNNAFGYFQNFPNILTATGQRNLAIGSNNLNVLLTGNDNISIGTSNTALLNGGVSNTVLGNNNLIGGAKPSNNTCIGQYILPLYNPVSNIGNNTAVGSGVLPSLVTGTNNSCYGTNSGLKILGSQNTCIGYNTGQLSTDTNTYNNSTAIGAGTIINSSNQIVLGTSAENVIVNGAFNANNIATKTITPTYTTLPTFTNAQNGYSYYNELTTQIIFPTSGSIILLQGIAFPIGVYIVNTEITVGAISTDAYISLKYNAGSSSLVQASAFPQTNGQWSTLSINTVWSNAIANDYLTVNGYTNVAGCSTVAGINQINFLRITRIA